MKELQQALRIIRSDIALNFTKKNELPLFIKIEYQEITENEENYFQKLNDFMKALYTGIWLNIFKYMAFTIL